MPGPKEMLDVLDGLLNRRRSDIDYLFEVQLLYSTLPSGYSNRAEPDYDDTTSLSSHSTNSTVDDNPGTGRLMDKYFYQALGRKFERLIFRIKLPILPPARISGYFEGLLGPGYGISQATKTQTNDLRRCISYFRKDRRTCIYGLKCLVKQTKSSSLYQAAAALASLIHVTTLGHATATFYMIISQMEPIYHVETLASTLDDSQPVKKYTFLLLNLAKAHLHTVTLRKATAEICSVLRNEFMHLLDSLPDRLVDIDLIAPIVKACHIYARALSCALWPFDLTIRLHGLESIYLILIFFLYSILTLCSQVRTSDPIEYRFLQMVLSTLTNWLDSSLMSCIDQTSYLRHYNMRLLDCISSIRGLVHAIPMARVSLPKSFRYVDQCRIVLSLSLIRRICKICAGKCHGGKENMAVQDSPMVQALVHRSMSKSVRLFASFTELKREARNSSEVVLHPIVDDKDSRCEDDYLKWDLAKQKALQVRVPASEEESTTEFREALAHTLAIPWHMYMKNIQHRRGWAPFFRSNLDWDWDVAESFGRLYALEDPSTPPTNAHRANLRVVGVDAEADVSGTWNLETTKVQMHTELPKEVRIPYKTKTGEIKYMTFARVPEPPDALSEGQDLISSPADDPEIQDPFDPTQAHLMTVGDVSTSCDSMSPDALETLSDGSSSSKTREDNPTHRPEEPLVTLSQSCVIRTSGSQASISEEDRLFDL